MPGRKLQGSFYSNSGKGPPLCKWNTAHPRNSSWHPCSVFHSEDGRWVAVGGPSAPAEPSTGCRSPVCSYMGFFSAWEKAGCKQQEKEMAPVMSIPWHLSLCGTVLDINQGFQTLSCLGYGPCFLLSVLCLWALLTAPDIVNKELSMLFQNQQKFQALNGVSRYLI